MTELPIMSVSGIWGIFENYRSLVCLAYRPYPDKLGVE